MVRDRIPRASKTKAIAGIATTIQILNTMEQMNATDEHENPAQVLRIPAPIWNAYASPPLPVSPRSPPRKLIVRLKYATSLSRTPIKKHSSPSPSRRLRRNSSNDTVTLPKKLRPRVRQRQCKVKLWRFKYGGPSMKMHGKSRNEITLEQPCLKRGCASCWKWHRHLMDESDVEGGSVGSDRSEEKGTDNGEGSGSGSGETTGSEGSEEDSKATLAVAELAKRQHSIMMDLEGAPLRDRRVTRLVFRSRDGQQRYEDLVEARKRKREMDASELERKEQMART